MRTTSILAAATYVSSAVAGYTLAEDYFSGNFFDHFNYENNDPSGGSVNYVTKQVADDLQFTKGGAYGQPAFMGVDNRPGTNGLNNNRGAVRLSSKSTYTKGLVVLDAGHIPIGCGLWPAFWSLGDGDWPSTGEIDIIEGVHNYGGNAMTLHTGPGCSVKNNANGWLTLSDGHPSCVSGASDNQGCGYQEPNPASFQNANANGGGTWAMEWTDNWISIWWWNPHSNPPPADVHSATPNPALWGKPSAMFGGDTCDGGFNAHFKNHRLIFNIDFCGPWAGDSHVWAQGCQAQTGAATCNAFVNNNAGAFNEAYWSINSLKRFSQ